MFDSDMGEGGYFADGGGAGGAGDTPKRGKGDQNKRAQNLLPVTTRQVRNANESVITIGGIEFSLVTLVGRVTSIERTSVKINYTIQDDCGSIQAIKWLEQDSDSYKPSVVENDLCRVYGSIRSQGNEKMLMAFNIRPLTTLNELTSHYLEVMVVPKRIQKKNELNPVGNMESSSNVGMNGGNPLGNSLMDMGAYGKTPMSTAQRQVLGVIKMFQDPGVHVNDINNHLATKLTPGQINKICEDLMNEGHIYSSIDEFHFLCTEN